MHSNAFSSNWFFYIFQFYLFFQVRHSKELLVSRNQPKKIKINFLYAELVNLFVADLFDLDFYYKLNKLFIAQVQIQRYWDFNYLQGSLLHT